MGGKTATPLCRLPVCLTPPVTWRPGFCVCQPIADLGISTLRSGVHHVMPMSTSTRITVIGAF
jgi:hypothetical protein